MDENLLYDIIAGLRSMGTDSASSSSVLPSNSATRSVDELLSEISSVNVVEDSTCQGNAFVSDEPSHVQDKENGQNEECCSFTSSNRESWGRCSSLGGSDDEPSACTNDRHQMTLNALATPLRSSQRRSPETPKDEKKKKKKKVELAPKKPKREKFEKLEALSQRLRLCILRGVNHHRNRSS
ncbi:hypothetical protein NL676_007736 [Syzygium grande]|nr:hypothetical protein NL676_007736 [Syzygium grande]